MMTSPLVRILAFATWYLLIGLMLDQVLTSPNSRIGYITAESRTADLLARFIVVTCWPVIIFCVLFGARE